MTVIETKRELIDAIAYAALARRKAQLDLESGARDHKPTWTMRQLQRSVNQADRHLMKLADTLAEQTGAPPSPIGNAESADG